MNRTFLFRKDMTPIKKLLYMKAAAGGTPLSEYTATGNPLSFNTNIVKPLKSLVLPWTPTQSGTGDPSPSNVRPISGVSALNVVRFPKNLLTINRSSSQTSNGITFTPIKQDNVTVAIRVTGTNTGSNTFFNLNVVNASTLSIAPGTYKAYGYTDNVALRVFIKNSGGAEQAVLNTKVHTTNQFTIPSDAQGSWMRLQLETTSYIDETIYIVLLNADDAYNNLPVVFPALGKNLLNPATLEQGAINANTGVNSDNSARVRTKGYIQLESGQYCLNGSSTESTLQAMFFVYGTDGTYKKDESSTGFGNMTRVLTLSGERLVRIAFKIASGDDITPSVLTDLMLNSGVSALPYEPYTNTVYGGSLDVTTGVLTVEYGYVDLGALKWTNESAYSTGQFRVGTSTWTQATLPLFKGNIVCDMFAFQANAAYNTLQNGEIAVTNSQDNPMLRARYEAYAEYTGDEFKTAMDGCMMAYELYQPYTIQLSPTQITSLLGDNTIWSDTNGSNTAIYLKKG